MTGRLRSSPEPEKFLTCPVCCSDPSPVYQLFATGLEIGHDGKAHRIYGCLRSQVKTVEDLARMSDKEILGLEDIGPRALRRIRTRIPSPGLKDMAAGAGAVRLLQLAARQVAETAGARDYELARAIGAVLLEAAEDYACCGRINAKHKPAAIPEVPNPVSEAVLAAARILMENP